MKAEPKKGATRGRRPLEEYLGARGAKFAIFPGSSLAKARPQWVMAAELVETSRLWGRVVAKIDPAWVETSKYKELLFRAAHEVLQPMGVKSSVLRNWMFSNGSYLLAPGFLHPRIEFPIFANLERLRIDTV